MSFIIVPGLFAGKSYKAQLSVKKAGAWSEFSAYSSTIKIPLPAKPAKPEVQCVQGSCLQVSWATVEDAQYFTLIVNEDGKDRYFDWASKSLHDEGKQAIPGSMSSII